MIKANTINAKFEFAHALARKSHSKRTAAKKTIAKNRNVNYLFAQFIFIGPFVLKAIPCDI